MNSDNKKHFSYVETFEGGYNHEQYLKMKEIIDACEAIRQKITYANDDLDNAKDCFFSKTKKHIESGIIINGVPFGSDEFDELENVIKKLKDELTLFDDTCVDIINSTYQ